MNRLFGVLGLMMMAGSIPAFAQNVGVGYKADGSDVSGDFAEAEGDGASVSADVTVGFKIGKKIAIAIKQPDGSFTTNPLFHPNSGNFDHNDLISVFWLDNPDFGPHLNSSLADHLTNAALEISGGIYSNTDVSVTVDPAKEFINEDDPSSTVGARGFFTIGEGGSRNSISRILTISDDTNFATSAFPATTNLSVSQFTDNSGVLQFYLGINLYRATIDATDRSGNYYASTTFTVTAL